MKSGPASRTAVASATRETPRAGSIGSDPRASCMHTLAGELAEDIAEMVSFLASEKATFITGQVFHIDGGKSIGATVK